MIQPLVQVLTLLGGLQNEDILFCRPLILESKRLFQIHKSTVQICLGLTSSLFIWLNTESIPVALFCCRDLVGHRLGPPSLVAWECNGMTLNGTSKTGTEGDIADNPFCCDWVVHNKCPLEDNLPVLCRN